eukprot:c23819_g1_i3 orf=443-2290(+)
MENLSAATEGDDFIDIALVRILDLRGLGQDEIQCLAQLCGDVPARLQDLVNVVVDKSIFNESAGSRRQTFDRDRLPRNRDRRLSAGSASAQLHLAIESAGRSHRDVILNLCRQLQIAERGDKALYQQQAPQPAGVVVEGNRSMSLKRMARASFTGKADATVTSMSSAAAANGKGPAIEVLHRSSKKMKTKEEARRRAAEFQAVAPDRQEEKHALVAVKIISSGHEERVVLKDVPKRAGGMNYSAQAQSDLMSPEARVPRSVSTSTEGNELLKLTSGSILGKPYRRIKILCGTCARSFANMYSLRRHTASTGHIVDERLIRRGLARKKKKKVLAKISLRCSCGNTYATPFTLRRHALTTGHTLNMLQTTIPAADNQLSGNNVNEIEGEISSKSLKLGKGKLETFLSKRSWRNNGTQFKCRHCHRQFSRKLHYVRHLDTHFKKSRKKLGRPISRLLGRQLGSSSDEVKGRPLGRPPKLDGAGHTKQGKVKKKRKHEPDSLDRRVKSRRREEETPQQTPGNLPSEKSLNITCQECGRKFEEFSRYTGHLSMHARLRKIFVGEASTSTNIISKKINIKELSALGFRKLLNDTTGTYLPGLPAKLLFSESDLADKQRGEV